MSESTNLTVPGPDAAHATKNKGLFNRIGSGIKNSPKIVRKAMGSVKKRLAVGKSKDQSTLKNCQENGWLYKDSEIEKGINYKVKYLGSVEVDYDPNSTQVNQENAQKAMRALYSHAKATNAKHSLKPMILAVSVDRITLKSFDAQKIIMRHSTTRIAYSTVDTQKPKVFAYVAVVKNTKLSLCHVFRCNNAKQGYEMTFVCAQAFDMNYRRWREDEKKARAIAQATEADDVEPSQAWQKKKNAQDSAATDDSKAAVGSQSSGGDDDSTGGGHPTAASDDRDAPTSPTSPDKKIFLAILEGHDPAELAESYFNSLGISMIEDDDDDLHLPINHGGMMQIGVDTEAYNASAENTAGGYMTVGNSLDFEDDEEEDDDEL